MKKILVTGGTVFVSKYVAKYYVKKGYEVYVLNRNTKPQAESVKLIEADRSNLGDVLKGYHFDFVFDIVPYTATDIENLVNALDSFGAYIMISSSAVYPETEKQPFVEEGRVGNNKFWGAYGTNKIEAEKLLQKLVPNAYILRPPYLYGPGNNLYREAFVFDCAMANRKFYLPKDGKMKLQFLYVEDLCKFMDIILAEKPETHVFNVGDKEVVTIREWVEECYAVAGKEAEFVCVYDECEQRNYFSFYDYEYYLDVSKQQELMKETKPLSEGLKEAYLWYKENKDKVSAKEYMKYIDEYMANPWEEISLSDYENHMKLDSVMQLQMMNQMMKRQFNTYPVCSVMILGIAGGNGLEHVDASKFNKVYGIDINEEYIKAVKERYSCLSNILECIKLNLLKETDKLPQAELLVANLLIEYIGYDCFQKAVKQVQPQYISCIIQVNVDESWVSDSPYIHAFDDLDKVHHQMEENSLIQSLKCIGYKLREKIEQSLPNGKKLVQLDFENSI